MNIDAIRDYCLAKPGVEESLPFGPDVLVFKVSGKMFLLLPLNNEPVQFNVKCTPELAIELREQFDCIQPGYHMNKKHWNTIIVTGKLTTSQLKEWIDLSYSLISESKKIKTKN